MSVQSFGYGVMSTLSQEECRRVSATKFELWWRQNRPSRRNDWPAGKAIAKAAWEAARAEFGQPELTKGWVDEAKS